MSERLTNEIPSFLLDANEIVDTMLADLDLMHADIGSADTRHPAFTQPFHKAHSRVFPYFGMGIAMDCSEHQIFFTTSDLDIGEPDGIVDMPMTGIIDAIVIATIDVESTEELQNGLCLVTRSCAENDYGGYEFFTLISPIRFMSRAVLGYHGHQN